jgi:hypothetical protein
MSVLLASQGLHHASRESGGSPRGMMLNHFDKNTWESPVSWASCFFEISFNSYKPFACGIVIQHRRLRQLRRPRA